MVAKVEFQLGVLAASVKLFFASIVLVLLPLSSQAQEWLYAVRPGDTLWDLCLEYTNRPNCWQTIGEANNVQYERRIPPGTIIKFPIDWLKIVPDPVTITYIRGTVQRKNMADQNLTAASVREKLSIGTTVVVAANSTATLKFADGSILVLDENSELELNALSANGATGMVDSRVRLHKGSATTRVPERETNRIRFQIQTPGAVAAVRGTNFRVSTTLDENSVDVTHSEVVDGAVEVATSVDSQRVNQGYGIIVSRDQPAPPPIQLLAAPAWENTSDVQMDSLLSEWEDLEGATAYKLELLSDSEDAELIDSQIQTSTSFTWNDLAEQCYRISVRGIDRQNLQGLPAIKRVCVEEFFAGPDINGRLELIDDKALRVSWTALEQAVRYEVELAKDPKFENVVARLESETETIDFPVFETTNYFVRVRAISESGARSLPGKTSEWSTSQWDKKLSLIVTFFIIVAML